MLNKSALIDPLQQGFPPAWAGNISFASWLVSLHKPETFVELGTHSGNSYCAFCRAIKENNLSTRAYAVDSWLASEPAGTYDEQVFLTLKNYHDHAYGSFSQLLRMALDEAVEQFPDGSIDLLHIDELCTSKWVRHDFKAWLPKLSQCGIVLFHDTHLREGDFGLFKLWKDLANQYQAFRFKHSNGLCMLLVGRKQHPVLAQLAQSPQICRSSRPGREVWGDSPVAGPESP